jgi:bifunctional DNA-binding transcriptional regulator/antitoxin component of YhaV-PrlF toxin-antitoxin module
LVKLQFDNNKQYKITLPKALIDAIGWKKGSLLKIELDSLGNIVLKRKELKDGIKQ